MGRYIECIAKEQWEIVWKYGFEPQNSEMHRIPQELGLGQYRWVGAVCEEKQEVEELAALGMTEFWPMEFYEDGQLTVSYVFYIDQIEKAIGDELRLTRLDFAPLGQQLEGLKQQRNYEPFVLMVEALWNFMNAHPNQEEFFFEGEF
ncbi:MAG: hypothetical protein ACRC8A_02320 [Microcoleaceae cyanobacterium]